MTMKGFPYTTKFKEIDNFHPNPHSGLDIALPLYSPIEALKDGEIYQVATNNMLGNHIRLKTYDNEIIVYGHIAVYNCVVGQKVKKGEVIALSGGDPKMKNQGHTTGPHLHLSIYQNGTLVDPAPYVINYNKGVQDSSSSPFLFPLMIVLLLIIAYKARKWLFYLACIILLISVIFLVS